MKWLLSSFSASWPKLIGAESHHDRGFGTLFSSLLTYQCFVRSIIVLLTASSQLVCGNRLAILSHSPPGLSECFHPPTVLQPLRRLERQSRYCCAILHLILSCKTAFCRLLGHRLQMPSQSLSFAISLSRTPIRASLQQQINGITVVTFLSDVLCRAQTVIWTSVWTLPMAQFQQVSCKLLVAFRTFWRICGEPRKCTYATLAGLGICRLLHTNSRATLPRHTLV